MRSRKLMIPGYSRRIISSVASSWPLLADAHIVSKKTAGIAFVIIASAIFSAEAWPMSSPKTRTSITWRRECAIWSAPEPLSARTFS